MKLTKEQQEKFDAFCNSSHALFTVEFAQEIAGYFGQDCLDLVDIYETSDEPKAYHGPTAEGVAAFQLSPWLCNKLGIKFSSFFGRGSQHRACCELLAKKLE